MTNSEPDRDASDLLSPRRARARRRARRRTRRRAIVGTGLVTAVVTVVLVATGVVFPRSDSARARGDDSTATQNASKPRPRSGADELPAARALSADAPLKLWIGGDSLAGSLGPSLGAMTAQTGVVAPQFDSRVSTGLTTPDFFDWPAHATQEMARLQPEAVVFIIDTNDANGMPALGTTTTTGEAQWRTDYAERVERMMQILIGDNHRRVYWVGTPVMKEKRLDTNVRALDAVIADVASRHPEATYVDVNSQFTDSQGSYTTSLTDADGKRVTLRAGDGVHLTPAGGGRMATSVFDAIDTTWHLRAQAVPGHVQPVLETQGSSQVPGTGRGVSGHSSGGGSTGNGSPGDGSSSTTTTTLAAPEPTTSSTEPTTQPTQPTQPAAGTATTTAKPG